LECTASLNGCPFCLQNVKFIPIGPQLRSIIESFGIRCPNFEKGCKTILKGANKDISKHVNAECEWKEEEEEKKEVIQLSVFDRVWFIRYCQNHFEENFKLDKNRLQITGEASKLLYEMLIKVMNC
jgi:hypothetical protein